jgi:hypothetical protein
MSWYRSKVDWWVTPVLCIPPISCAVVGVALLIGEKTSESIWFGASVLLVFAIYFGLVFPMRYGIDDGRLVIRFGVCRQTIPLENITEVSPTRNPLSSPALSLDRLLVRFGPGLTQFVMISPADREAFLDELAMRAELDRDGDRLVRE